MKYHGIFQSKNGGMFASIVYAKFDHWGLDALRAVETSHGCSLLWATTESGRVIFNG